jgi:hypothetical protein
MERREELLTGVEETSLLKDGNAEEETVSGKIDVLVWVTVECIVITSVLEELVEKLVVDKIEGVEDWRTGLCSVLLNEAVLEVDGKVADPNGEKVVPEGKLLVLIGAVPVESSIHPELAPVFELDCHA